MQNAIEKEKAASAFAAVITVEDLAKLLGVSFSKHLVYYLYRVPPTARYFEFEIKKRKGGTRTISAPATSLKLVQKGLVTFLHAIYHAHSSVHGFTENRSIITNAAKHVHKRQVFNFDIENFFGSINFGRVRGMFIATPYKTSPRVATVLAQICCHNNCLPQGAPTSPIISNMICSKLDSELKRFSVLHGFTYTRYADDITFSTNLKEIPEEIAYRNASGQAVVGPSIRKLISKNGFKINDAKTTLRTRNMRQEVTGLVVNQSINVNRRYIKNLRALLHAWQKFGLAAVEKTYTDKYAFKSRFPGKQQSSLTKVAYGRIQHVAAVRGRNDPVYAHLRDKFNELSAIKIPVPKDAWLEKVSNPCWVVEDYESDKQGTAFFLKDYGLITCEHCVGAKPFIYHPRNPSKRYAVEVIAKNAVIDLAILKVPSADGQFEELIIQSVLGTMKLMDATTLVGYPQHAPGKQISIKPGHVQSFTTKSTIRRFNISAPIIAGNSGGPVLSKNGRVVGVAVTGADSMSAAGQVEEHGVIPISALKELTK